jgi:hypothetical protein
MYIKCIKNLMGRNGLDLIVKKYVKFAMLEYKELHNY